MRWREPDCKSDIATDVRTDLDNCSYTNCSPSSSSDPCSNSTDHHRFSANYSGCHNGVSSPCSQCHNGVSSPSSQSHNRAYGQTRFAPIPGTHVP